MAAYNEKVSEWYKVAFSTDSLGTEIDKNITFEDVAKTLIAGKDVYEVLGVGDSVIRERVFEELAKIYEVDYGIIYGLWLDKGVPGALEGLRRS